MWECAYYPTSKETQGNCYSAFIATGFRKYFPVTELLFSKEAIYCGW